MNVTDALAILERVRGQLGAVSVTACFETGHGDVQVVAEPRGLTRIVVHGQEVPHRQEGR